MTSAQTSGSDLLRVARPRECNTQQTPQNRATTPATGTQQGSLKALALLALGRNNARNKNAGLPPETAQQTEVIHSPVVAQESGPSRVACVAFPTGATAQQPIAARPVLHFRLRDHAPNAWATALGRPGETIHDLTADLRERYGDHLTEIQEQER